MKAYTISSSSRAMSVARGPAGSWTTSPPGSVSGVISWTPTEPLEEVAAQQVRRVCALHVRAGVHHHVPVTARGPVRGVDQARGVRDPSPVRDDRVERVDDGARLLAAADVNVRHVL